MRIEGEQSTRRSLTLAALIAVATLPTPLAHVRPQEMRTVVVIKAAADDTRPEALVRALGGRVVRPLTVIDGFVAAVPQPGISTLGHAEAVRSVTLNQRLSLQAQYGQDSGVAGAVYTDVVRAGKTWAAGHTGTGITVAVVDTGVNTTGDLAGQVVRA